ncbi:MAG: echA8 [Acidimicrobiales bacterium]|nr:echA8 [Acidimicrobiales bacterium]
MPEALLYEVTDGVATLSFNRPDRHNAFNAEMFDAALAAVARAASSRDVRAVVVRGEGPSFSSGIDTGAMGRRREDEGHFSYLRHSQELNLAIAACPKPVIAALRGHVLGKGLETALSADMRIVGEGARLGFPEVHFGLSTDNGGAARVTALAGPARAKYLIMSGDSIDAERAVSWGLAEWAVPAEELDVVVADLAHRLAERAPVAVSVAKELVDQFHRGAILNGTRTEMLAQIALFSTADHAEAKAARHEKRPPDFDGR